MRVGFAGPGASHYIARSVWEPARVEVASGGGEFLLLTPGAQMRIGALRSIEDPPFKLARSELIDGLIVFSSAISSQATVEDLKRVLSQLDVPVVSVGFILDGITSVTADCSVGISGVVDHLVVTHGARNFGVIGGPEGHWESNERIDAVRTALANHGVELDDSRIVYGNFSATSGRIGVRQLLGDRKLRVDTIFAANDTEANGAIRELRRMGLRVPQDMRVVGYDDSPLERTSHPLPTTVNQPFGRMGVEAVHLLRKLIAGRKVESVELPTTPVIGESCGCLGLKSLPDEEHHTPDPELVNAVRTHLSQLVRDDFSPAAMGTVLAFLSSGDLVEDGPRRALDLAFESLAGELSDDRRRLLHGAVQVMSSDLSVLHERAYRLALEQRSANELELTRLLDDVVSIDEIPDIFDAQIGEIGVSAYHVVEGNISGDTRTIASTLPGCDQGKTGDRGDFISCLFSLSHELTSADVLVVTPLPFSGLGLGTAAIVVDTTFAGAADTIASMLGSVLHRVSLMREIEAREAFRRQTVDRLVATENRLAESERLAALGRLVTDMAHELNTPIGVATTAASFLRNRIVGVDDAGDASGLSDLTETPTDAAAIDLIERSLRRLVDLVDRVRAVAPSRSFGSDAAVDLTEAITTITHTLRPELDRSSVSLTLDLSAEVQVRLPVSTVTQMLYTLLTNCIDHGLREASSPRVSVRTVLQDDGAVLVSVSDNGRGIASDLLPRVVEPFFTTARASGHVGLGLYGLHNAVTSFGGKMNIESYPNCGFSVDLLIPAHLLA